MHIFNMSGPKPGDIIKDGNDDYFKLHSDGQWRFSNKIGEDRLNKDPVSPELFAFPLEYLDIEDYSLEEKLAMLTNRVKALENKEK